MTGRERSSPTGRSGPAGSKAVGPTSAQLYYSGSSVTTTVLMSVVIDRPSGCQQSADQRCCFQDVLEIVEYKQELLVVQNCHQSLIEDTATHVTNAQDRCHCLDNQLWPLNGDQIDKHRPVPKPGSEFRCNERG